MPGRKKLNNGRTTTEQLPIDKIKLTTDMIILKTRFYDGSLTDHESLLLAGCVEVDLKSLFSGKVDKAKLDSILSNLNKLYEADQGASDKVKKTYKSIIDQLIILKIGRTLGREKVTAKVKNVINELLTVAKCFQSGRNVKKLNEILKNIDNKSSNYSYQEIHDRVSAIRALKDIALDLADEKVMHVLREIYSDIGDKKTFQSIEELVTIEPNSLFLEELKENKQGQLNESPVCLECIFLSHKSDEKCQEYQLT